MKSLSRHEIWEEILFGNVDRYRVIVDLFPDVAEHLATPSGGKPPAKEVVRCILNGNGPAVRMNPTTESLLENAIRDSISNHYGFRDWLKTELYRLIGDEPPEKLIEEVVEVIPDDLEEPNELPVQWPEDMSRKGHRVRCQCAVCQSKRT